MTKRIDPLNSIAKSLEILTAGEAFRAYVIYEGNETPMLLTGVVLKSNIEFPDENTINITYLIYSNGKLYEANKTIRVYSEPLSIEDHIITVRELGEGGDQGYKPPKIITK